MIFQASFRRFLASMGFSNNPGAEAVLGAAFEAGENAVLGERDVPALLKAPVFQVVDTAVANPVLTQAQINYLLKLTATAATVFQEQNTQLKQFEQMAWTFSDKDTDLGKIAFSKLNEVRNARRKLAKHRDRLNGVIVALKKAR